MSCDNKHIFWIQEPSILYSDSKFLEFIPTSEMNRVEQLNAITRFAIYFIILALLMQKSAIFVQIPIIIIFALVGIYFVFKMDKEGMVGKLSGIDINAMGEEEEFNTNEEVQEPAIIESGYYDSENKLHIGTYLSANQPKEKKLKINLDEHTKYEKQICRKPTKENPFMNPLLSDITINTEMPPVACNANDEDVKNNVTKCYNEDLYRDVGDLFERHNSQRQFYTVPQMFPNDQTSFANWCYKTDNICKVNQGSCLRYEDLRFKRQGQLTN
jgi:hypothetical protein